MRIQKYLSSCGITSRRKAEKLIEQGKVFLNGLPLSQKGAPVDPQKDLVEVNGQIVDPSNLRPIYLVLNKPRAVVSTLSDPEGRKTVADLVSDTNERIYPVGRLDYLSEGLLIMTNDGPLAQRIAHPKHEIPKIYEVKVFGKINPSILKSLKKGIPSKVGPLRPDSVRVIKELPQKTWLEFRLTEGKNREIRRLCESQGLTIDKLKRVAIGQLTIENLPPGAWRLYSKSQLLKAIEGLPPRAPFSPKKSLRVGRHETEKLANQKKFTRYRKQTYYKTLKGQIVNYRDE